MPQLTPQQSSHGFLGHLRRNVIAYVALLAAFALSPVPSMAAELVTTGDIANGAVTQPKLAADSVVGGKIVNESVTGVDIRNGTIGAADVAPLQWHNFTLINGWTNANGALRPPAWAIDGQGVIHLRGAIKDGSTTSFARLPASVRPSTYVYVATSLAAAKPGRIVIDPTGYLQADYDDLFQDAIDFTTLDGVAWAK